MGIENHFGLSKFEEAIHTLGANIEKNNKSNLKKQFIHTYGLAIDIIRHHMMDSSGNPEEVEHFGLEQLLRAAYAASLVSEELAVWKQFQSCYQSMDLDAELIKKIFG